MSSFDEGYLKGLRAGLDDNDAADYAYDVWRGAESLDASSNHIEGKYETPERYKRDEYGYRMTRYGFKTRH